MKLISVTTPTGKTTAGMISYPIAIPRENET